MSKTGVFDAYAAFYDLLYKDKNYAGEAEYIDQLITKFSSKSREQISLLDLACGTGRHLFELSQKKYGALSGSDISAGMIDVATKNASQTSKRIAFFNHSFQESHRIPGSFDVVLSMFSALNYLTTYADQSQTLRNIHNLLNDDGLFIFDYWNGHAVTQTYSPVKVLRKKHEGSEIVRVAETTIEPVQQSAIVEFTCNYFEGNNRIADFSETHVLHYYYFSEMRNLLMSHGFEVLHVSPFMNLTKEVGPLDWNISMVCKKVAH